MGVDITDEPQGVTVFGKRKQEPTQFSPEFWGGDRPGQGMGQASQEHPGAAHPGSATVADEQSPSTYSTDGAEGALAPLVDRLYALEDAQNRHIGQLTAQLEEKDRTLAAMNEAVAASRRDQVAVLLTPAAKKLIDLEYQARNSSLQQREGGGTDRSDRSMRVAAEFDFFAEKVDEALEALGFERLACAPGTPFDARQHQAVDTTGTEDVHLDRTVYGIVRQGYAFAGSTKVAFPAKVIVNEYVYATTKEEN